MDGAIDILEKNGFYTVNDGNENNSIFDDKKYVLIISILMFFILSVTAFLGWKTTRN